MSKIAPKIRNVPSVILRGAPPLLLIIIVAALWRYYQYYIDPDAISYLNIVERYVAGDYAHAINAFWSPLGVWGTTLLVKLTGCDLFLCAIIFNTLAAAGTVIASQQLFHQFRSSGWERLFFGLTSALFWSYTVYFQSFTDIWQFFFLTCGLLILLRADFLEKPLLWILLGLTGTMAYFGKAYSFYFFPIMIISIILLKMNEKGNINWIKLLKVSSIAIITMMAAAFPWLFLIHEKYGIWTSSTAGQLNLSWWLVGTQEFRPGITVLVPPVYKGSLFYFEDPFLVQGKLTRMWDSPALFIKQIARVGFNAFNWVACNNRISAFYFASWIMSIIFLFKKEHYFSGRYNMKILVVLFLIFPLPYWLMTFDGGRYLWFTIPLVCILHLFMAERLVFPYLSQKLRKLYTIIFFLSFLVTPVLDMKEMFRAGQDDFEMAQKLKDKGINGSFATNRSYADGVLSLTRIAWFTQNPWYCHTLNNFTTSDILADARRYGVKYYFYFYEGSGDDYHLEDKAGKDLPDLTGGSIPGIKVFEITK